MAARYFNWKLAIVLVVALVVFAAAAFALHQWRRSTRAKGALDAGETAYEQQEWDKAADQLGHYLSIQDANDPNVRKPVLLKYADAQLKRRPVTSGHVQQAITAYRSALRLDRESPEATRRLVEIYLAMKTMQSLGEAELIAREYLLNHDDPILSRMLARSLVLQRKYQEAQATLANLIQGDLDEPNEVAAYEALGLLAEERPDAVSTSAAERFKDMVTKNPQCALAYVARAGFHLREARRAAQVGDLEEAKLRRADAKVDLDEAEKHDLFDTDVHLRLVRELTNAGAFDKANAEAFDKADTEAFDKAKAHLEVLQAIVPAELMLWQTWAELLLRSNAVEEMPAIAETALGQLGAQPWDFMPTAVELFIWGGEFSRANDCISQMREKDAWPAVVAFKEGLLAERQGQLRKAVVAWQEAVALDQRDETSAARIRLARTRMSLSSAFTRLGDVQSAIGQLETVTSEYPDYLEGHLALARLLFEMRNWTKVLEQARHVQRIAPGHTEGVMLEVQARMALLAETGESDADSGRAWQDIERRLAQLLAQQAELDEPTKEELQIKLLQVQAAIRQGKLAEAAKILEEIKNHHPSELSVALFEAELLVAEDNPEQAIASLRETAEQFPQALKPVQTLALLLNQQKDPEGCESVLKQAVARMEQPQAQLRLSLLLADFYALWAQEDQRYQWLTDVAEKFPDKIQAKRSLLTCRRVMENPQQAQALVDEMKSLEGETGWQWRYEQAKVWVNSDSFKDHYTQTVDLLRENLLANPDDQESRLLLAVAHENAGQLQLALSMYQDALSRSPDNVQVIIQTVMALEKTGQSEEARRILDRASQRQLYHPDLKKLQFQSDLQRGALGSASEILEELIKQDPNDTSVAYSFAWILMRQGKLDEAEIALRDLRAKMPQSVSVIAMQIQLYVQQGNAEEAIRLCDETVEDLDNAFAYRLRAQTYVALGQNEKAIEDFGRATRMEPNNPDVWVARSSFYQSLGRTNEAIEDIRKALSLAPESLPIQKRTISLFMASGRRSLIVEAEAILDRAMEANPEDIDLKLVKARRLLDNRTSPFDERARNILQEITRTRPQVTAAWELLGTLELQLGQAGRAVNTALGGLKYGPQDRQLLLLKAQAEAAQAGSQQLAVPTLKLLADRDPNDVDVIIELARAYVDSGEPATAVEMLRARLAGFEGPARRRCELTLAAAMYEAGDKNNARVLLGTLMDAEPDDPSPLFTLAQLLALDKRWIVLDQELTDWLNKHPDDTYAPTAVARMLSAMAGSDAKALEIAESLLQTALERDAKSVATLRVLANLTQTVGRFEESANWNRKVLELDPNHVVAINNLAWTLCEEQGQCQEALKLANRGLEMAPEYVDLIDTRGVVHYRLGDYEKAVSDFERCIELYRANAPPSVASRFHLARAYSEMGRKTQAIQELKETLRLQQEIGGGLSPKDMTDARLLLDKLQQGG